MKAPTWDEVDAAYRAGLERLRDHAQQMYEAMVHHVTLEAKRTDAAIQTRPPDAILPKHAAEVPSSLRTADPAS